MRKSIFLWLVAALAATLGSGAHAAAITKSFQFSAGYALAFGGLNHLDTGFPVTRNACRFQGNACTTSYKSILPIEQFDPSLGTLTGVDITYTSNSSFSARIQNRPGFGQPAASGTWTTTHRRTVLSTIALPGVIANDPNISAISFAFPGDPIPINGFASTLHPFSSGLGSASIGAFLPHGSVTGLMNSPFLGLSTSRSLSDAASLAAFTGLGVMSFEVGQHSQSRASSNSNSAFTISGLTLSGPPGSVPFINTFIHNFAPRVDVTYTFDELTSTPGPTTVPEPGTLALFVAAVAGLGYSRRKLKR